MDSLVDQFLDDMNLSGDGTALSRTDSKGGDHGGGSGPGGSGPAGGYAAFWLDRYSYDKFGFDFAQEAMKDHLLDPLPFYFWVGHNWNNLPVSRDQESKDLEALFKKHDIEQRVPTRGEYEARNTAAYEMVMRKVAGMSFEWIKTAADATVAAEQRKCKEAEMPFEWIKTTADAEVAAERRLAKGQALAEKLVMSRIQASFSPRVARVFKRRIELAGQLQQLNVDPFEAAVMDNPSKKAPGSYHEVCLQVASISNKHTPFPVASTIMLPPHPNPLLPSSLPLSRFCLLWLQIAFAMLVRLQDNCAWLLSSPWSPNLLYATTWFLAACLTKQKNEQHRDGIVSHLSIYYFKPIALARDISLAASDTYFTSRAPNLTESLRAPMQLPGQAQAVESLYGHPTPFLKFLVGDANLRGVGWAQRDLSLLKQTWNVLQMISSTETQWPNYPSPFNLEATCALAGQDLRNTYGFGTAALGAAGVSRNASGDVGRGPK